MKNNIGYNNKKGQIDLLFKEENSWSSGREERMDLEKYLFKYVRVETNYGEIIVGYV